MIGLQAGTNKYASQSGMSMGAVRHAADIKADDMTKEGQGGVVDDGDVDGGRWKCRWWKMVVVGGDGVVVMVMDGGGVVVVVVDFGGMWWTLVECGGWWWNVVDGGGWWWMVVECGGW